MPSIRLRENESVDIALRRFRRSCEKAGILAEARRRECYEKPAETRKRKLILSRKRNRKRRLISESPKSTIYNPRRV